MEQGEKEEVKPLEDDSNEEEEGGRPHLLSRALSLTLGASY